MGAEIDRLEIEIEAAAAKANKELDKLVSRLGKISGSLLKIDASKISGFSSNIKTYTSEAGSAARETKNVSNSLGNLSRNLNKSKKSFSQMAGSFYSNFFLVIRGIKKLGEAVEKSMDYVETYNYFSVTMDKIGREFGKDFEQFGEKNGANTAEAYADSFRNRLNQLTQKMTGYEVGFNGELFMTDSIGLGLDPEAIMNYQASIASVTNSVGLIGENSVNVSKALTMLAADMSSLKNIDLSTVMTNFQSGIIGQSRALYKYGIDITNATLQTYAYELGLSKSVSEMTQAEKMQLRLIAILDQSKVAWGDAAITINSVANQYRILKQQISNLARVIGNLFLPIVSKVLPVINGLLIALQRLFNVLGFKLWGNNWLSDIMDNTGGVGGSDTLENLEDSAEGSADSLNNAADAAKKLKNTVLGIDELNINSPDTDLGSSSNAGGSTGGIDLSGAIGDALAKYESVWEEAFKNSENKAQEYANRICNAFSEAFKTADFTDIGSFIENKLVKALNSINWKSVYNGAKNFGKGLATFLNGLISPELFSSVGTTIAGSLNTALNFLNSFGITFQWEEFGYSLAAGLKSFLETWDAELTTESLSTFAKAILESVKGALDGVREEKVFRSMAQKIVDFICGIDWSGITWDLVGLFTSLALAIAQFPFDVVAGTIEGLVKQMSEKLVEELCGEEIEIDWSGWSLEDAMLETLPFLDKSWWSEAWDKNIKPWFTVEKWSELLNGMTESFSLKWEELRIWWSETALVTWWEEDVEPWFTAEKWLTLLETVKTSFKKKWNETSLQWKTDLNTWWTESVAPWFTAEKWTNLLSKIPTVFKETFKNAANAAIEVFNKLINWINDKMSFSWDAVPMLGIDAGSIQLVTIPTIPQFATGGFPETGQLFLARENGINEMVGSIGNRSVVANNDQIVESVTYGVRQGVMDAVSQILAPYLSDIAQNTRETADKDFSVSIGDREIAKANERGRKEIGWAIIS